jgi:anti-sigma-K factor RskA
MIDERTEELAALHALDLLEGAERTAFEARLAGDLALQALVRELREIASTLALSAPNATPSPELRARVLAQVAGSDERTSAADMGKVVAFRRSAWIPWTLAASLAIAAAWFGEEWLVGRQESQALETEIRLADFARRDAENHLKAERILIARQLADADQSLDETRQQLADATRRVTDLDQRVAALSQELKSQGDLAKLKIATLTSMLGNSPQALAVAIWDPARQEGIFTVDKLPAAEPDQDYQLWLIDPALPAPVSGGVFAVGTDGQTRVRFKADQPVAAVAKFAVSRERKGGAPRHSPPQGQVILISQ